MSIYATLDGAATGQISTNNGWSDFTKWVDGLEEKGAQLAHVTDHGWSQKLGDLETHLKDAINDGAPSADVKHVATELLKILSSRGDAEVLTITNGLGPGGSKMDDDQNPDSSDTPEKHGSKALRTAHKAMRKCAKMCRKAAEGLDDDSDTKGMLDAHVEALDNYADEIKAHHGKKYKDADPIEEEEEGKDDDNADADADKDEEEMGDEEKALLAQLKRQEAKLKHRLRLQKQSA